MAVAHEEKAPWSCCPCEQWFLQGRHAMLSVAWLYRQDEVELRPPLPGFDPGEVCTDVAQCWLTLAV